MTETYLMFSKANGKLLRVLFPPLQEAEHNRAVHDKVGRRRAVGCTTRASKEATLNVTKDLELFKKAVTVAVFDSVLRPLTKVGVPGRGVVCGDSGNTSKHVERGSISEDC